MRVNMGTQNVGNRIMINELEHVIIRNDGRVHHQRKSPTNLHVWGLLRLAPINVFVIVIHCII